MFAARDYARCAKAGAAVERPCDEACGRPSPKRGEAAGRQSAERQGLGGFIIVERALRDLRVKAGGDDVKTHKRAGRVHRLNLLVEMRGALDRLVHVVAAFARQRVGIVLEPLQGLSAGQVLALNLAVELGDDAVELFERAAQALTVLLREFGRLRADQSGQHGDRQG
jgi:hypothetical protein